MDAVIEWFANIEPRKRRRWAIWLLFGSLALGHLNLGLFAFGWISPELMDAITNYLSWLAVTFTAIDILLTTDVRAEQADAEG